MNATKHLPLREQNPKCLFSKYVIQKVVGTQALLTVPPIFNSPYGPKRKWTTISEDNLEDIEDGTPIRHLTTEIDEGSEYFVLRLDEGGKDPKHITACRKAIHAYADAIEHHIPQLAQDLRERYPLL